MSSSTSNEDSIVIKRKKETGTSKPEQLPPQSSETIAEIRQWLHPTEYDLGDSEYRKHLSSHAPGTGSWLTSSATYREWLHEDKEGLLWIQGIPGSGKSVITAHIINELKNAYPESPVLYFFFRQTIDANRNPTALLRDWQDQMLEYSPSLQKLLVDLIHAGHEMSSISTETHWKNMRLAISSLPKKVFCVADALDEMDEGNDKFVEELGALAQLEQRNVKVMITSRPVYVVRTALRKTKSLHITLEPKLVDPDICSFVDQCLRHSSITLSDREKIKDAVPGRANGLFIYARLALNAFLEPGISVEEVLEALPKNLNELYDSLLREHARRSDIPADAQLLILRSVIYASRPLRLLELAEMVSVTFLPSKRNDIEHAKNLIRTAAGPLLQILPDESLCVIHHSFTEYLQDSTRTKEPGSYPILDCGPSHTGLALACLAYLRAGCLEGVKKAEVGNAHSYTMWGCGPPPKTSKPERRATSEDHLQYPFMAYAAANWSVHAKKAGEEGNGDDNLNTALDIFFGDEVRQKAWVQLNWADEDRGYGDITVFHIAARNGLHSYTRHLLLTRDVDVDAHNSNGKTPLWWAAKEGHHEIIRVLVQHGANADQDESVAGFRPLHVAAKNNHAEAVHELLTAGVSPLTKKTRDDHYGCWGSSSTSIGHTPLFYACNHGHLESLEAFIPFLDTEAIHLALYWSTRSGKSMLVKRLLEIPNIDVNKKIKEMTYLFLACSSCDRDTIELFIQMGADPKVLSTDKEVESTAVTKSEYHSVYGAEPRGFTALHGLCIKHLGHCWKQNAVEDLRFIIDILLTAGANIQQRDRTGRTALHHAVGVSPALVRLLLAAGADANAIDDDGYAPIHMSPLPDSISALMEDRHADINKTVPSSGDTPLICIFKHKFKRFSTREETLSRLLEYRPNLKMRDKDGNSALHLASSSSLRHLTMISSLLEAGADPNDTNKAGETCLYALYDGCPGYRVEAVDILCSAGTDVNLRDSTGATVAFKAIETGSSMFLTKLKDLERLLESGSDILTRDNNGRTLLHAAVAAYASKPNEEYSEEQTVPSSKLTYLIGKGLDPKSLDHLGNSLLHEFASRIDVHDSGQRCLALWKALANIGVCSSVHNNKGRTPLHILCSRKMRGQTRALKEKSVLDLVLELTSNIDAQDSFGLSPLHLAVTVSEYTTRKLLQAGANACIANSDGLTPLHLAARARQCNNIGLLIDALKASPYDTSRAIEARDLKGRTPLYYACRSGIPESVALIIQAGADATDTNYLSACAEFESEQELWARPRAADDLEANLDTGALTLNDLSRPTSSLQCFVPESLHPQHCVTLIQEIIGMLTRHDVKGSAVLSQKTNRGEETEQAVRHQSEDTARYLVEAQSQTRNPANAYSNMERLSSKHTEEISQDTRPQVALTFPNGQPNVEQVSNCLFQRRYDMVEQLFSQDRFVFTIESHPRKVYTTFQWLIASGFHTLVDAIGTMKLQKDPSYFADHPPNPDRPSFRIPLLLTALSRERPNMEMVRLLVQKFQLNVNDFKTETNYRGIHVPRDNALHFLARGNNWWHVHLALPYLLSCNADIDARNSAGKTPLHVAIGSDSVYRIDATRAIIAAGADVNLATEKGETCLALASNDVSLLHLLASAGSVIDDRALLAAVDAGNVEFVEKALGKGFQINASITIDNEGSGSTTLLYHAARPQLYGYRLKISKMIEMLISYGADLFAQIVKAPKIDHTRRPTVIEASGDSARKPLAGEQVTLLHDLILDNGCVHPIIKLPHLDLEYRDQTGRTIFLAICQHMAGVSAPIDVASLGPNESSKEASFIGTMLARGVNLHVRDNNGRNALHLMSLYGSDVTNRHHQFVDVARSNARTIARVAAQCPELLDQTDDWGRTPLSYAASLAERTHDPASVSALVEAGADLEIPDNYGNTVLHRLMPAFIQSAEIRSLIESLLKKMLDVNHRNRIGQTPLFEIMRRADARDRIETTGGTFGALESLQKAGVDIAAKDKRGQTLLHLAAANWQTGSHWYSAFLEHGLDPMDEDNDHKTSLDIATACSNEKVLALFTEPVGAHLGSDP